VVVVERPCLEKERITAVEDEHCKMDAL